MKIRLAMISMILLSSSVAMADWTLLNEFSQLNFLSIKNDNIAENHRFTQLSGTISDQGEVRISVPLTSVDTGIAIRNQRMQKWLFQTASFPTATLSTTVDAQRLLTLEPGLVELHQQPITVSLHGQRQTLNVDLLLTLLPDNRVLVFNRQPVIVQAETFNLAEGIDKLREIAGLKAISSAVPVSFYLTFQVPDKK